MNRHTLAVTGVQSLHPYKPGKPTDELARELGLREEDIVKLASNENPLPVSEAVKNALINQFSGSARYPDGNGFELKRTLAEKLGVGMNQITLGNGSSDLLDFIVRVFVNDNDSVVMSQHAFAVYGLVATIVGAKCTIVPAKGFGHDLDAMADAITDNTRVVFVTNPNNPTGTYNTREELVRFLDRVPDRVMVLLDEAYFEYVQRDDYPDGIALLSQYPNLLVTRTFSKAYGLASLRVGYGVSSPEVADLLNRVRPPFNVNTYAQAAAVAALNDHEFLQNAIQVNNDGLAYLSQSFEAMALSYIPSVANFITFKLPEPFTDQSIYEALLQKGVIVRPVSSYDLPNYLRVSVGTHVENERFITALAECLNGL